MDPFRTNDYLFREPQKPQKVSPASKTDLFWGDFVFGHKVPLVCMVDTGCIFGNISCVFLGQEISVILK